MNLCNRRHWIRRGILAVVVVVWIQLILARGQGLSFLWGCFWAVLILVLQSIDLFLKWNISEQQQHNDTHLYCQSLLRELDYLKDEHEWNGNARLEVALQNVTSNLEAFEPPPMPKD